MTTQCSKRISAKIVNIWVAYVSSGRHFVFWQLVAIFDNCWSFLDGFGVFLVFFCCSFGVVFGCCQWFSLVVGRLPWFVVGFGGFPMVFECFLVVFYGFPRFLGGCQKLPPVTKSCHRLLKVAKKLSKIATSCQKLPHVQMHIGP